MGFIKPRFSGDHTTQQIRGMWQICFNTRRANIPYFPLPMHVNHCDCVVDASREIHSSTDYVKIDSDNLTKFFVEASVKCDADGERRSESLSKPKFL